MPVNLLTQHVVLHREKALILLRSILKSNIGRKGSKDVAKHVATFSYADEPKRIDAAGSSGVNGWVAHLVPPRKVRKTAAEHRAAFLVKRNPSTKRTEGGTDTDSQARPDGLGLLAIASA